MRLLRHCVAALLFASSLATGASAAAPGSFALLHSLFDPGTNSQGGEQQGYSVAIDGNLAVTGAPFAAVGGPESGVAKVYNATTGGLLHTLTNPSPSGGDRFGLAVSISGARVLVGAPYDDTGAIDAGRAYVYDLAGATPAVPVATLTNPSPTSQDHFGFAVGISGKYVVVGALGDNNGAGSVYAYDLASATPAVPVATLASPSPQGFERFGRAVAISGTRAVIGADEDNTGAYAAGSAYVYDLASTTPSLPFLSLTNPTPVGGKYFGNAVAMADNWVVVAAYDDSTGADRAGIVYAYDLSSGTPAVPVVTLTNPSPAQLDRFGNALALSGTRVVVGAANDDTGAFNSGSTYVYNLASLTPAVPLLTLTNPSPAEHDSFGFSVAFSGTRVVVGASYDGPGTTNAGSAYVFDLVRATPTMPAATLNHPSPASFDWFGQSVAVCGTRVVVGAAYDDTGAVDSGSAYVYDLASQTPTISVLTLTNPSPAEADQFGCSVAVRSNRVVVGAMGDNTGTNKAGSAYVYDLASATPKVPVVTLTNPSPAFKDQFGNSVAISGSLVVVGAQQDGTGATNAGSAYVYDLNRSTPSVPVTTLNNPTPESGDFFGRCVSIDGTRVVVGAYRDNIGGSTNSGTVYVYALENPAPAVPMLTLTNPSARFGDEFGSSVAISGTRVVVGAPFFDPRNYDVGNAYVFDLTSAVPTLPLITLTNPAPVPDGLFGYAVGISGTRVVIGTFLADGWVSNGDDTYVYDLASVTPTKPVAALNNPSPAKGDRFGSAVAIDGTLVVAGAPSDDSIAADRGAAYIFGLSPVLSIAPFAPGIVRISWAPTTSSGFVLQFTDSLAPANWVNAPSGAANPVIVPTGDRRFYRLFQP